MFSRSYKFVMRAVIIGLLSPSFVFAQDNQKTPNIIPGIELQKEFSDFDMEGYTLDIDEFIAWYNDDDVETVILDLRSLAAFDSSHINGAKHLGADINEEILSTLIPSKKTRVIVYCSNSLQATRLLSLTNMSLPQLHILGYENSYMLGPIWDASGKPPEDFPLVSANDKGMPE